MDKKKNSVFIYIYILFFDMEIFIYLSISYFILFFCQNKLN